MTNISQWNFTPVVSNKEQIFKIQILHQMKEISMKKSIDEIIDILVPKIPRIEKEPYYETIQNVMIKIRDLSGTNDQYFRRDRNYERLIHN